MAVTELSTLREAIGRAMLRDQHTFRARLRGIDNGVSHGRNLDRQLASLTYDVEASVSRREERQRNLPRPAYPQGLPVVEKKDEIAKVIAENQVVVLCGETGSGKTTLARATVGLVRPAGGRIDFEGAPTSVR